MSNAALAMMRGGKSSGQSGKNFGFVRRNKGVDVEETIEDDVLLEEDEDEEDEDEERWEIDEDQQAWNRDQILDHRTPPSQMNVLVAGDVSGNVACFGFGAFFFDSIFLSLSLFRDNHEGGKVKERERKDTCCVLSYPLKGEKKNLHFTPTYISQHTHTHTHTHIYIYI